MRRQHICISNPLMSKPTTTKACKAKGQCICFRTSLCGDLSLSPIEVSTWKSEVLTEEHKVKRQSRTRENLWVHTLGPLKSSKSDSETLITASDWIGMFKGPRVCTHRFSHILPFHQLHLSVSEKTSGFQDTCFSGRHTHQKLGPPKMMYKPEHYYPNLSVLTQLPMATQSAMYNNKNL